MKNRMPQLKRQLQEFYAWTDTSLVRRGEKITYRHLVCEMMYEPVALFPDGMSYSDDRPFEVGVAAGSLETHFVVIVTKDRNENIRIAKPLDVTMLRTLLQFGITIGDRRGVWEDMHELSNMIRETGVDLTDVITAETVERIDQLAEARAKDLPEDIVEAIKGLYQYCYCAMNAEEHRFLGRDHFTPSKIGRRIKVIAMYQVLVMGMSPEEAAVKYRGDNPNNSPGSDKSIADVVNEELEAYGVRVEIVPRWQRMRYSHRDTYEAYMLYGMNTNNRRGQVPKTLLRLRDAYAYSVRPDVPGRMALWIRYGIRRFQRG